MDTSQLRTCFLSVLKNKVATGQINQMNELPREIALDAAERGFTQQQTSGRELVSNAEEEKIREMFWSFMIQGVVIPGLNARNPNFPFFTLTEYGRKVVESAEPVPHDPDQYLNHLSNLAPNLDEIAITYVKEGLECYQRGTYTASVVMLGVASEKVTLDLANAVQSTLSGDDAKRLLKNIERDGIAKIYGETRKRLEPRLKVFPPDLSDSLITHLDSIFNVIRTHRNEAGHPTGKGIDRMTAFGLFSVFPFYCRRASELIEYIKHHGLT